MLSLKRNNLEEFVFKALFFLAPTQLAFHWWPDFAHIFGIRVDYLSPTLYLTDILVLILAILQKPTFSLSKKVIALALFAAANIIFALNPAVAAFKWIKIFELGLLAYLIAKSKRFNLESWLLRPLSISIVLFSTIGAIQFILGRTIGGLFYFLGERSFSLSTPGIALLSLGGREFLRPYSTFSHPNSMAGYLLVASALIYLFKKKDVLRNLSLAFSLIAVLLSSSLGAYVASIFIPVYRFLAKRSYMLVIAFVALSLFAPILSGIVLPERSFPQTIKERLVLFEEAGKVFSLNPITGVGLNNFFLATNSLQPVHNIFLLVLTEAGILGLILFVSLVILSMKKTSKLAIPMLIILATGLFDHYWLTLQQNELLLGIVFGLSLRSNDKLRL